MVNAENAKIKIGKRPVLFLEVKIDNAVGEVPKKGQNKNWRASCAVLQFKIDNAVGEVPKKGQNKNWWASCAVFLQVKIE